MRKAKIGEIYWVMKASREEANAEKSDAFTWVIHQYLINFYLEDFPKDTLKEDNKERQEQVQNYFEKEFNRFNDPIRDTAEPANEFLKLFPKTEEEGEEANRFKEFMDEYEKWVKDGSKE